jgi:hypothetical protein
MSHFILIYVQTTKCSYCKRAISVRMECSDQKLYFGVMWGIKCMRRKKDSRQTGEKASAKKSPSQAGLKEAAVTE